VRGKKENSSWTRNLHPMMNSADNEGARGSRALGVIKISANCKFRKSKIKRGRVNEKKRSKMSFEDSVSRWPHEWGESRTLQNNIEEKKEVRTIQEAFTAEGLIKRSLR